MKIGIEHPPFIVAEISANHQGSLEKALKMVEEAKKAGVDAVKLQTYTPDTITLDVHAGEFLISDPNSLWKGQSLYELYQKAYTPWEWHKPIFDKCKQEELIFFSTPFDETAVDFLEDLNVPCYKIAALEIVDLPLIKKVAATKKPLIMSCGGATVEEIEDAVKMARSQGCTDIILLKCTTDYPADPKDCNLKTLLDMRARFKTEVGLSDHTLGLGCALASIAFGSCLIEKHFILSREENSLDSAFSLDPHEFKLLKEYSLQAWESIGSVTYGPVESEKANLKFRPSLYFVTDLKEGQIIEPQHVRSVRPSNGLPPKEIDKVIGSRLKVAVKKGTPVSLQIISSLDKKP